jgi:GDP-D-mannose 3',5'-epimerase
VGVKTALVLGGGGFIGSHLAKKLKDEGFWVRAVDLKYPEYWETYADDFIKGDLRDPLICCLAIDRKFDEIYQLAADMGGAGFVFTGANDADIMHNSCLINLNILEACNNRNSKSVFYSGSACMYPEHNQLDPNNPLCTEESAYPASPDSEYGWEKLFSERLYLAFMRNYGFKSRIARYHNIFGPYGTWDGGREKAPAAICRKIAKASSGDEIEIWGDGKQTRSFLYIDECVEATIRLMRSDFAGPVNIGSEEMVTINGLVDLIAQISGKKIVKNNIPGPTGVRGRNSDNRLIGEKLGWKPSQPLVKGLEKTYEWIESQVKGAQ